MADEFTGYVEVTRNITEQKQTEKALMEAENHYRTIIDFTYDWEYWENPDRSIRYMSPSCERITGYTNKEFIDNPEILETIIHPEDLQRWKNHKKHELKKAREIHFRVMNRTGNIVWIEHICQPVIGIDGENLGIRASNRDITSRKQIAESLKSAEENLKRAQSVARIGSWNLDLIGGVLYWSDETYKIFGISQRTPMTYEKFLNSVHPDDRDYVDRHWQAALNKKPYDIEHRIIVEGKVKWVREKAELEYDRKGKPLSGLGTVQDITEKKQEEENTHLLREQLAHTMRVGTLGELTAAMAHEINQPLTAIMNNTLAGLRFLQSLNPDIEEIKEIFKDILSDNKRASEIIKKLRDLMKKRITDLEEVDVNEIIREVLTLIHSDRIIKNIDLETRLEPGIPIVSVDRIQLHQVILNVILNAFDAMEGESKDRRKLVIKSTADHKNKAIKVMIRDYGQGIKSDHLSKIFEPFFSTKPLGLGIGLSINSTIIKAHGGKIWAKNNKDYGATVFFTLPIPEVD